MCRTIGDLLGTLRFEIAVFRGLPDEAFDHHTAPWLLAEFERVDRARFQRNIDLIEATEIGTLRALARGFGRKTPPDLPDYDSLVLRRDDERPAWFARFERANQGRLAGGNELAEDKRAKEAGE